MNKHISWFSIGVGSIVALGAVGAVAQPSSAATVQVTCQTNTNTPTVVLSPDKADTKQSIAFLNFLPKYFSPQDAVQNCQSTARNMQVLYATGSGKYLTTDKVNGRSVVCTVERRGMSCDHDNAQVLFSLRPSDNPTQALYDMLGNDFKPAKPLDSRTVGRIYTATKPFWWPF
jgi:hypothetical protein